MARHRPQCTRRVGEMRADKVTKWLMDRGEIKCAMGRGLQAATLSGEPFPLSPAIDLSISMPFAGENCCEAQGGCWINDQLNLEI